MVLLLDYFAIITLDPLSAPKCLIMGNSILLCMLDSDSNTAVNDIQLDCTLEIICVNWLPAPRVNWQILIVEKVCAIFECCTAIVQLVFYYQIGIF